MREVAGYRAQARPPRSERVQRVDQAAELAGGEAVVAQDDPSEIEVVGVTRLDGQRIGAVDLAVGGNLAELRLDRGELFIAGPAVHAQHELLTDPAQRVVVAVEA